MKCFALSMASSFDLNSSTAYPPTTSLASVKGPSIAVTCPRESRTRVLLAVGASPPLATIVPALTASSPSFAIASMNSLGGGPKFSACLTIIMNCIGTPLLCVLFCASELHFRGLRPGGQPCSTVPSNSTPRNRPRHSATITTRPWRTSERTCPLHRSAEARIHHHQQPARNLSLIEWPPASSLLEVWRTRRRLPSPL